MTSAADRRRREQAFHDRQADDRAATFALEPERLRFADDEYLDHEPWVRPAFARLGDMRGRRVLDYGCGHGMAAVVLARRGAAVAACDLSPGYVAEARMRTAVNGQTVACVVADCERLPFADRSFDAVWGHAILHHLDVPAAAAELRRVLKPGGVAVLCEPWGGNLLLQVARRWLPCCSRDRTPDEEPLGPRQIEQLRRPFSSLRVEAYQVLGTFQHLLSGGCRARLFERLDSKLIRRWPGLGRWARYVVIELR